MGIMKKNKLHLEIKEPLTKNELHSIRKEVCEIVSEIELYEKNKQIHHTNLDLLYDRLIELEYVLERSLYLIRRKIFRVIK